jgi:hypothetical protein
LVTVAHTEVGRTNELLGRADAEPQKLEQCSARLFVRQRHQIFAQRPTGGVNIAPLAGLQWAFLILDAHTLGFEACGQIGKGASVNQLTQNARATPAQVPNQVNKAKTIETEAGEDLIVDEVLPLAALFVFFTVIPANSQNLVASSVNSDDIREFDAIFALKTGQVKVAMAFVEHILLGG